MPQNIITAGDATSGGIITSGGNDGTLLIQTGPAGGKVSAINIDATGVPTFLKPPKLDATASPSRVELNTNGATTSGFGSTNTAIRRFTTIETNVGSDITYADSATNGASFTINTNGIYAITHSDSYASAGLNSGISKNSNQLTTAISGITSANVLAVGSGNATNSAVHTSWTGYLVNGDVIRPHGSVASNTGTTNSKFSITKVG